MEATVTCTKCGQEIEITKALLHQVEEQVKARLREDTSIELKDRENQVVELREQNKTLTGQLLELNKAVRMLKDQDEKKALDYEKRLSDAIDKIRQELVKTQEEKYRLREAEYEKKITDMTRALEDARAKGAQGSQQLQGEVLELNIEEKLRSAFPEDDIEPVGKGVQGGDIVQKVRNKERTKIAGSILWETKRAKWSPGWLPKLREDGRVAGATVTVLISEQVPKDFDSFGVLDGVVVTTYPYVLPLAELLRRSVKQVANAKSLTVNKDEKLEFLYQYIASGSFRHRFEAYAEAIRGMKEDLDTERRSMERIWKKREMQIQRTLDNMAKMYGELQGVMGSALPEIRVFSLPEPNL